MSLFKEETLEKIKKEKQQIQKRTILIVDDEEQNLVTLKDALIDYYDILTATDGQEALELLQRESNPERVHMVISDQRMPNMTGVELLRRSLEIIPASIRIILTGFTDVEAVMDSINQASIYKFILKPFDKQDILLTIKRGLEVYDLEKKNIQLIEALKFLNNRLFSHIRGNLQRIAGSAEMFRMGNIDQFTPEQRSLLQNMGDSTNDLIHLLNKASELSYVYTGHRPVKKEQLDIKHLVQKTGDAFANEKSANDLDLVYEWEKGTEDSDLDGFFVETDGEFLVKALREVLENAFNYSAKPATIVLQTFTGRNHLYIQVQDKGIGIKNEGGIRLFKPFVRGDQSEAYQPFGLGIGLANAKAYMEAQNGDLSSVDTETGSIVQLSLQLPDYEAVDVYDYEVKPKIILMHQKNASDAELYQDILDFEGHDIEVVTDHEDLLKKVSERPFDLIILDQDSQEKPQEAIITKIEASTENKSTPILVFSEQSNQAAVPSDTDKEVCRTVPKPLDYDQLISLIQQYT